MSVLTKQEINEIIGGEVMTIQDRPPNFRENGKLYLVRCFSCGAEPRGTENYLPAVASGTCAWCGWSGKDITYAEEKQACMRMEAEEMIREMTSDMEER
jgi:hypothetical protein